MRKDVLVFQDGWATNRPTTEQRVHHLVGHQRAVAEDVGCYRRRIYGLDGDKTREPSWG